MDLTQTLIKDGWLKTKNIIEAFQKIKREDFLPSPCKQLSQLNEALPIGYNQTISQPLVVAFMLETLQARPGDKVLDIGSGSGYTGCLLAEIVGPRGRVIALEIIPELKELGLGNASKYDFVAKGTLKFFQADGYKGYQCLSPYDKILCSAALPENKLPLPWQEQLKVGGRIVAAIQNSIWLFIKKSKSEFVFQEFPGFVFVPLV